MSGHLLVLLGLPRAGKSFYANNWQHEEDKDYRRVIINPDNIRIAFHGKNFSSDQLNSNAELTVNMITKTVVRSLYDQGYFVCVDAVNSTEEDIRYWLSVDKNAEFHYVDTPLSVCKERALAIYPPLVYIIDAVYDQLKRLAWLSKDKWDYPPQSYLSWDCYLPLEERIYQSIEVIRHG
jgi:predicted kinase